MQLHSGGIASCACAGARIRESRKRATLRLISQDSARLGERDESRGLRYTRSYIMLLYIHARARAGAVCKYLIKATPTTAAYALVVAPPRRRRRRPRVEARRTHISEGWITTGGRLADGIAETTGRGEGRGRTVMPVLQIYDYA